jgi:hypothetical protein
VKTKHYIAVAAMIIALLYVYHVYSTKGGIGGFKSGLGIASNGS